MEGGNHSLDDIWRTAAAPRNRSCPSYIITHYPQTPLTQPSTARHGWLVQEGWNSHQGPKPPKPSRHQGPQLMPPNRNNCHICGRPFLTTSRGAILLKVMEKHRQSHNPPKPPKPSRHQGPQLGPPNRKNCDICGRPFLTTSRGARLVKLMEKHKRSHNTSYYTFQMQILRIYESVEKSPERTKSGPPWSSKFKSLRESPKKIINKSTVSAVFAGRPNQVWTALKQKIQKH